MVTLQGKNIYITGGSSGIGLATAKLAYGRGASLVIIARDKDRLHQAARDIETCKVNNTQRVATVSLDVSEFKKVSEVLRSVAEDYGAPDCLIANAGILYGDYFENISFETFDRTMKTNVYGVRNVIEVLLPKMKTRNGRIVIVSSIAGFTGMLGYTAYSTSKFALIGFAESLYYDLKRFGMKVFLVCPPEVETSMIIKEAETLPPEARAVKNLAGRISAESAANAVIRALTGNRFLVIPGLKAKLIYYLTCHMPGFILRGVTSAIISASRKKG